MVTIGSTGYTTYTTPSTKKLEFSRVAGLNAYVVTNHNSSTGALTLAKVSIAPVGTPVILVDEMEGESSKKFGIPSTSLAADAITTNLLLSAPAGGLKVTEGDVVYYALANKSHGVGFYRVAPDVTIPAGKAYLTVPTQSGAREFYSFGTDNGELTAVEGIVSEKLLPMARRTAVYDLQGRLVEHPIKGSLYIRNNQKFIAR